jgi:23S rRNA (pseudouridine1915-N3)-methyltransferase
VRITVIQQGKLRDRSIIALREDYLTRFRRFGKLTVIETEPKGDALLWPASARWRVLLDERGDTPDSTVFAKRLAEWSMRHGDICFLVGDAYGPHAPTAAKADARLSLGAMTLPHQIAHLVLIEQIYRAATITAGLPYHHGPAPA